ncbi:hemolysin family protein [Pseudonocardia sp. WMMC193]|uniref:hemolysin family protein n=1 Tax=Pseudonocardia sp. WMMC193 TaxID=2911965 RepID=UPI001F416C7C|nr:hemolysin family protein [Pseudonocardia sp. WMMC193]MCF7547805.1 hemolysin family protein [Pseudonocardia sp. WMMC193]
MNAVGLLVIAIVLIPVAGVCAAADAAFTSVSSARVADLVRAGRPGARALARVVEDRARYLNLLILLRLMGETVATVLLTIALASWIDPPWLGVLLAAAIMVVVSYVLIGVGPRTLGRQHPYALGMAVAAPIRVIATLLGPITSLLILVGNAITPGRGFREGPFSSEVELRELVDMAGTAGVVDEGERKMIHSVFELGDTIVRDVMQPRPDVVWAERDTPVQKVVRLALKSGYSRIPVLGEDIDDIVGIAYLKDLVGVTWDRPSATLVEVVRPPVFVPDSKRIDELLSDMQRTRNHMAIVVDEYGGTAGLVTIEDILEEIVGDISDEYDTAEVPEVQRLDGGTLRLAARLPVEDLQELFAGEFTGTEREEELREAIEEADVDTIGGLLAQRLGKVPLPGAETEVEGLLHLKGEGGKDARGRVRITSVLVTPLTRPEPEDENEHQAEREPVPAAQEETDVRQ